MQKSVYCQDKLSAEHREQGQTSTANGNVRTRMLTFLYFTNPAYFSDLKKKKPTAIEFSISISEDLMDARFHHTG